MFIFRDGHHLLFRRVRQGIWHVVSGVVENGESFEEAGLRELREESGLALTTLLHDLGTQVHDIDAVSRHEYPPGLREVTLRNFAVEAPVGWEPVLNEEHDAYRWCPSDEAREALYWPGAREMIRRLDGILNASAPGHPRPA